MLPLLPALLAAAAAHAQCTEEWLGGQGLPGTNGPVYAVTTWDPDGPGPATRRLVFGGDLTAGGDARTRGVGTWDPATSTWGTIGNGFITAVRPRAFATLPSGELIAGGSSTIARFDGTTWIPFQGTMLTPGYGSGLCRALVTMPNGDLIAGGDIGSIGIPGGGGVIAYHIARWNGSTWAPIGGGLNGPVASMVVLPNGDLVVTGTFTTAGGNPANNIARWDGATWSPLGAGLGAGGNALALLPNGDLVAGGFFTTAGGAAASYIARWNGSTWSPLGSGCGHYVYSLCTLANGSLAVGGMFATAGGQPAGRFAIWNGAAWSNGPPTSGAGMTYALTQLANGDVIAGGGGAAFGSTPLTHIARWDGAQWQALAGGMNNPVNAIAQATNGDIFATGQFTTAGRVGAYTTANRIARWSGNSWQALGSGLDNEGKAVIALPGGGVAVGGSFTAAGGTIVNRIARWNGGWSPYGTGMSGSVLALATLANGDLVAGGGFATAGGVAVSNIARWSGTAWQPLGTGVNGVVNAMLRLPNGDLLVGGSFSTAGGAPANCVARWTGSGWASLSPATFVHGTYTAGVRALLGLPNGDVIAGGLFSTVGGLQCNHIARWNGAAWSSLAGGMTGTVPGYVNALAKLPSGDLVAGGAFYFAGGVAATHLARWHETTWAQVGAGTGSQLNGGGFDVRCLLVGNDGALHLGGAFTGAGGVLNAWEVAGHLGRASSSCPALSQTHGAACPSSGGANSLTPSALPWIGSTFRATGTGLPTTAFVFAVTSLTPLYPGIPLAGIVPQGQPGCWLAMTPDSVQAMPCLAGTAESSFDLPYNPALIGIAFYHQMLPWEVDASLQFLGLTATNGLRLQIGAF
ncbi:MAG: hypothetical protein WAT39_26215 [Planctomycetota bacterium]